MPSAFGLSTEAYLCAHVGVKLDNGNWIRAEVFWPKRKLFITETFCGKVDGTSLDYGPTRARPSGDGDTCGSTPVEVG